MKRLKAIFGPILRPLLVVVALSALILAIEKPARKPEVKKLHFALLQYNDSPLSELSMQGIYDGLASAGYVKGRDYEMTVSNAQGDITTLNLITDAALTANPDLIFATSTPTLQAAVKKITARPVVFTVVADPVLAGAGTSFASHLPNITGISTLGDYGGMAGWVHRLLPKIRRAGTLFSPGELNSVKNMNELKSQLEKVGVELLSVPVSRSDEVPDALLTLISEKPDVICQIVDNLTSASSAAIIHTAKEHGVPVFGFVSDQAKDGAVLVVSRDYHQAGVDAVRLAVKILNGSSPARIPFEYVSRTNILINPKAAADFRIKLPDSLSRSREVTIIP